MHHTASLPSDPIRFVDVLVEDASQDRGCRVLHFLLTHQNGSATLAVVGTERGLRDMSFTVSVEFARRLGLDKSAAPVSKWRSRRDVVDWLKQFTWKPSFPTASEDPVVLQKPKVENGISSDKEKTPSLELATYTQDAIPTREILWIGKFWTCRRQFRHYNSFQRNGIIISINTFVYVMSEGGYRHIAYIEDLYEDKKCQKKVRVRWFHKSDEVVGSVPSPEPHPREVFITPFPQVLSVECLDGRATVLNPEHYEKYALTHQDFALQVHLCFRQFDNDGIKPFDISTVKGYWSQQALPMIGAICPRDLTHSCELASDSMENNEDDEAKFVTVIKKGPKGARSSRKRVGRFEASRKEGSLTPQHDISCGTPDAATGSDIEAPSTSDGELGRTVQYPFVCGDKVEILCQDSGMRGCWFRCVILKKTSERVKVRYEDLESGDENGNLEEWISPKRIAIPDKLGIRASSRLVMRPLQTKTESKFACEIGTPVDAWWNDGWWEGVITGKLPSGKVLVYFPDENDTAAFPVSELRISRDWVNGQWLEMKDAASVTRSVLLRKGLDINMEGNKLVSEDSHALQTKPMPTKDKSIGLGKVNMNANNGCNLVVQSKSAVGSTLSNVGELHHKSSLSVSNVFSNEKADADRDKENKSAAEFSISNGVKWRTPRKRTREVDVPNAAKSAKLLHVGQRDPMSTLAVDRLQGREIPSSDIISSNKKEVRQVELMCPQPHHEQSKPMNGTIVNGSLFNVSLANLVMSR